MSFRPPPPQKKQFRSCSRCRLSESGELMVTAAVAGGAQKATNSATVVEETERRRIFK